MGRSNGTLPHVLRQRAQGFVVWLRRHLPASRVLQVEEIASAVREHLRAQALCGLSRRYLPSSVTVYVSPEDLELLHPFEGVLHDAVMEIFREFVSSSESKWRLTTDRVSVRLREGELFRTGGRPQVEHSYGSAVRRAEWRSVQPQARSSLRSELLDLIITVSAEDGTAMQDSFALWLSRELPVTALNDESGSGINLRINGGGICDSSGAPWEDSSVSYEVFPPPQPSAREKYLPSSWDGPWVHFRRQGGRQRLIWCPGGTFLIGREGTTAHLAVNPLQPTLSAPHLALWSESGQLLARDLATTNGTHLDGYRMDPGRPIKVEPPLRLELGGEGRVLIEIGGQA